MSQPPRPLHRLVPLPDEGADADLLHQFVSRGDLAALECLVRRHGPMVLAACRRILGNWHDADDAFQATFLVFVRKAGSIRKRGALAGWLYGVACRAAWKARALRQRRQTREQPMTDQADRRPSDPAGQEALAILDEELHRLPELYRTPIVLCDLGAKTGKQAAQLLGCPEGTLTARLTRGRRLLAARLTRRGVTLSAALAAGAAQGTAAVPPPLLAATVHLALGNLNGAAIAPVVATLTDGVLKSMLLTKLTRTFCIVMVLTVVGGGATVWARRLSSGEAKVAFEDPPAQPAAAPAEGMRAALLERLRMRIWIDGFEPNTPLRDALGFLSERYDIPLSIDGPLFQQHGVKEPEQQPIKLSKLKRVTFATVLRRIAAQVQGTFLVRDDNVVLVPSNEIVQRNLAAKGYRPLPPPASDEGVELRALPLAAGAAQPLWQMRSGIATGTFAYDRIEYTGDRPERRQGHGKFTLQFDGRRFYLKTEWRAPEGHQSIKIRDGSGVYCSVGRKDTPRSEWTCNVEPADQPTNFYRGMPCDPSRLMRGPGDIAYWLANAGPPGSKELASGGYLLSFRDGKTSVTFEVVPEFGWNVARCQLRQAGEETPWGMRATWKQAGAGWQLASLEAKRGSQRYTLRVEEFQPDAPVSPRLFRLAALELPKWAKIFDRRPEAKYRMYAYQAAKEGGGATCFDMDAELESLPLYGRVPRDLADPPVPPAR